MNDADLSAVVKQYNDLQTAQGDTATSMAELETDFSNSLTKIQTDMETAVDNLNLSDEAKANAKSTMDAYVKEIKTSIESPECNQFPKLCKHHSKGRWISCIRRRYRRCGTGTCTGRRGRTGACQFWWRRSCLYS